MGAFTTRGDPIGKMFFGMLALMAEFESDLIRSRTVEGMREAAKRGRLLGKPSKLSVLPRKRLLADYESGEYSAAQLMDISGLGRAWVHGPAGGWIGGCESFAPIPDAGFAHLRIESRLFFAYGALVHNTKNCSHIFDQVLHCREKRLSSLRRFNLRCKRYAESSSSFNYWILCTVLDKDCIMFKVGRENGDLRWNVAACNLLGSEIDTKVCVYLVRGQRE